MCTGGRPQRQRHKGVHGELAAEAWRGDLQVPQVLLHQAGARSPLQVESLCSQRCSPVRVCTQCGLTATGSDEVSAYFPGLVAMGWHVNFVTEENRPLYVVALHA